MHMVCCRGGAVQNGAEGQVDGNDIVYPPTAARETDHLRRCKYETKRPTDPARGSRTVRHCAHRTVGAGSGRYLLLRGLSVGLHERP